MKMLRRFTTSRDFDAPLQPGEVIFTPLQQTRILLFLNRRLGNLRRFLIPVLVVTLVGTLSWGVASYQFNERLCDYAQDSRTALREVIADGIGDIDRDGKPDRAPTNLNALLDTPTYQALAKYPEAQAMWNLVLSQSQPGNTTERLEHQLQVLSPITC